jgi:hypothetical protein
MLLCSVKGIAMRGLVRFLMVFTLGMALCAAPSAVHAETKAGVTQDTVCASVKQLVDKVATAILNDPSDEAFDVTVQSLLRESCALRAKAAGTPALVPTVEALTAAILGWAWDASNVLKFKAERNASAADIAARGMKRQITRIQTICPAIVVPNVTVLP